MCTQLKLVPEWASRTHTTQECGQLAKFNKQAGEGQDADSTPRIRRENYAAQRSSSQRSYTDHSPSPSAQYTYYDSQSPYASPYPVQLPMPPQTWLPQQPLLPASHTMGQYRPGVNIPMVRSANMSSMTSPHPQSIVRDETGEYEDVQRDLRQSYTPEYRTMYPQSASTPSTVRSVSRDQMDRDSASANVAMKPSDMGRLTEEQKQARDKHIESMHRALFSNYLIDEQQQEMNTVARSARTAYKEPKFESHQAMPAITVRDSAIYNRQATLLAQQWGRDKVSASTQTEQIRVKMVEISMQTVVEMSTQTEPENQLVSFAENVSPGNVVQGKQQEMQLMTTGVSTVDNGEIDYEEMPDLVYDTSEETLESEWFKLKFLTETIIRVRQVES